MRPPSYIQSVVERNIVLWHIPVYHTCTYNRNPEDEPCGLTHVEDIN